MVLMISSWFSSTLKACLRLKLRPFSCDLLSIEILYIHMSIVYVSMIALGCILDVLLSYVTLCTQGP